MKTNPTTRAITMKVMKTKVTMTKALRKNTEKRSLGAEDVQKCMSFFSAQKREKRNKGKNKGEI